MTDQSKTDALKVTRLARELYKPLYKNLKTCKRVHGPDYQKAFNEALPILKRLMKARSDSNLMSVIMPIVVEMIRHNENSLLLIAVATELSMDIEREPKHGARRN